MNLKGTYHYYLKSGMEGKLNELQEEIRGIAEYVYSDKTKNTEIFVMHGSNVFTFKSHNNDRSDVSFSYTKNAFYDPQHLPFILELCNEKYEFEPRQENN
ncbi:MAG: hypothetical protein ACP5NV_03850 [Candidatus Woesearchaeota archaeon]